MHNNNSCDSLSFSSELGEIYLSANAEGITELSFGPGAHSAEVYCPEDGCQAQTHLLNAKKQLEEYFAGTRTSFDVPLAVGQQTPFTKAVFEALAEVPYGKSISYKQLATKATGTQSARAVGNAMKRNPVPIIVPCHRVTKEGGKIGGYQGSLNSVSGKSFLLEHEAKFAVK